MTSILASAINSNSAHLRLWVLLLHFRHILLELRWSVRFCFHKVDLGVPRVVVSNHYNTLVAEHRLSLHWPNHIRVNSLKKSSLCLILQTQRLERLPEHPSHGPCLTSACRWALSMQLDTSDCIREPLDSWQGEMAEATRPHKEMQITNRRPNVGLDLGDIGNGARSNINCHRASRD